MFFNIAYPCKHIFVDWIPSVPKSRQQLGAIDTVYNCHWTAKPDILLQPIYCFVSAICRICGIFYLKSSDWLLLSQWFNGLCLDNTLTKLAVWSLKGYPDQWHGQTLLTCRTRKPSGKYKAKLPINWKKLESAFWNGSTHRRFMQEESFWFWAKHCSSAARCMQSYSNNDFTSYESVLCVKHCKIYKTCLR